jgi:hypothetical protein
MRNPGAQHYVNSLKNLGPLTEMAGIWEGSRSLDIPPKPLSAPVRQAFVEHMELQPIDPQANGPQLFYGLRSRTSSSRGRSRPTTIRWAIGCGSRRPAT